MAAGEYKPRILIDQLADQLWRLVDRSTVAYSCLEDAYRLLNKRIDRVLESGGIILRHDDDGQQLIRLCQLNLRVFEVVRETVAVAHVNICFHGECTLVYEFLAQGFVDTEPEGHVGTIGDCLVDLKLLSHLRAVHNRLWPQPDIGLLS